MKALFALCHKWMSSEICNFLPLAFMAKESRKMSAYVSM